MIPQDTEYTLGFLLYIEKFLEFLMRLDRLGIKVVQHEALNALLTNAYQIHTMHLLKEGMYLGSTWVLAITEPKAAVCYLYHQSWSPGQLPEFAPAAHQLQSVSGHGSVL
ncbi:MAG: hypothetical protein U5L00_16070 [Desulfovermiculus sp.]|nr:hypothetical protein [Desulfovermiculus sp.]